MDSVFSMRMTFLPASFFFGFVISLSLALSSPSHAQSGTTQAQAMAACQRGLSKWNTDNGTRYNAQCIDRPDPNGDGAGSVLFTNSAQSEQSYPYTVTSPPADPCASAWPTTTPPIWAYGKVTQGSTMCRNGDPDANGARASCRVGISPKSAPVFDTNTGAWKTLVQAGGIGGVCGTPNAPPADSSGKPIAPEPILPDTAPTVATPAPKICGGGSCYDPNTGNACAVDSSGAQVCVKVPSTQNDPGTCSTGGETTICAGNPNAPAPPPSAVPSPPTQIQSSDSVKTADPKTGAPIYSQVPVYSTGATPKSGASAGDSTPSGTAGAGGVPASGSSAGQPAHSSSSSDKGSYGGGKDCVTPPACSGDAVACGAATTQWATTCTLHKDLTGDGAPSDFDALKTAHKASEVVFDAPVGTTAGDAANTGIYDQSGMGYSTECPLVDLELTLWQGYTVAVPFSKGCVVGEWIRFIVIGFALFSAAIITKGGVG